MLACLLGWLGVRGALARGHLNEARADIVSLRAALASGDRATVPPRLASVQRHTRAARRLTSDPLWRAAARAPYVGRSLRTGAGVAAAVDGLARTTLPEVDAASRALDPGALRRGGDTVALEPFDAAREPLGRVAASVAAAEERVRDLPGSFLLPVVHHARTDVIAQLADLREASEAAVAAARIAPPMLGRDGPRRYFLAILNNAEMRASGGLLGAYGILEADRGRLRLTRLGTNADLTNTTPVPAVDLGEEFATRYRRFSSDSFWLNGNMSPHFPYASEIWTALWAKTHRGERLDGTIAVDPVGLSRILAATGPVTVRDGEVVDAGNVVRLTESEAYARFGADNAARDRYLLDVARATYQRLLDAPASHGLLQALGTAAGERHLQVASAHGDEQRFLEALPVGGALPMGGAYLEVVTQNAGGNKLDYYLRRTVERHRADDGTVTVTVRLRNDTPRGLPAYVNGRLDLPPGAKHVEGAQYAYVSVYVSEGAELTGATLDGEAIGMESETERRHPVFSEFLELPPGRDVVLVLTLTGEPPGEPRVRPAPLVTPDTFLRSSRR